jgi:Flp pilus assembly protein TadD
LALLADLLIRAKEFDEAGSLYRLGRSKFPNVAKWTSGVARVALLCNEQATLRESLEELVLLEPDDPAPRKALASMAAKTQDWSRAIRFAHLALQINVADADSHGILADALAVQEQWRLAAEHLRILQLIRPTDPSVTVKLARALLNAGDRVEAAALVRSILEKHPTNLEALEIQRELQQ